MYTMPVKAIKNILKKELESFKNGFFTAELHYRLSDVMKEFIYIAHNVLEERLESCTDYDSLEKYISFAGYRMSLQEWIDSL